MNEYDQLRVRLTHDDHGLSEGLATGPLTGGVNDGAELGSEAGLSKICEGPRPIAQTGDSTDSTSTTVSVGSSAVEYWWAATSNGPGEVGEKIFTAGPAAGNSLYFLTNRMNLNGVLSSRLLGPRESFHKYYKDLLQQTPGWVPLLTKPPNARLIDMVTEEHGAGAPVIIEFAYSVANLAASRESVVYLPAVALSDAKAIHFPALRDLRAQQARRYRNVHADEELLRVSPELFRSGLVDELTLAPPMRPPKVDWHKLDRIRGAVSAAVAAATSGEQLALVAAALGAEGPMAATPLLNWLDWSEIDDHAASGARVQPDRRMPDRVFFRVAYDILAEHDISKSWSPNEVLDEVSARFRQVELPEEPAGLLFRNLERVRAIVDGEADFEPLRPSSQSLVSARALLLLLLRPELGQLLAWPEAQTGADGATRVVGGILAGRLRGLSRESTELRSQELDDLTGAWAVRSSMGASELGEVRFLDQSEGASLWLDGIELKSLGGKISKPPEM
ncbi:hypothetical protein [Dietzia psychralcaliphila]|uniref:hypothetical protein n=1 Tax=Dietzia psychralcaliphila TaxID=139021 RepID=UPI001C1E73F7|nr:hypothetical protein [Dietzia psychralcaliphila]